MRQRLLWLLPVFQVGLALILGTLGSVQTHREFEGHHIFDYVALPEFVLHIINFPAAAVVCIVASKWSFQIGPEYSVAWFLVYLVLIGLLWNLIGRRLGPAGPAFPAPSNRQKMEGRFGVGLGVLVLLLGVVLIQSPLGYFVSLAAFVWGIVLIILFRHKNIYPKEDGRTSGEDVKH
jgi:hypothetical protein